MKHSRRLSELIEPRKSKKELITSIKDYRTALFIYSSYLNENYLTMWSQIKRYGEEEFFFRDLMALLRIYYQEPNKRNKLFSSIIHYFKLCEYGETD